MFTIIYDRNYRRDTERELSWEVGQQIPDIAPHRIVELHAEGKAKAYLEDQMGALGSKEWFAFYGDFARTVFINLEDPA